MVVEVKGDTVAVFDEEVHAFELDLLAFFQGLQGEAFSAFKQGVKDGLAPEAVIDRVIAALDGPIGE